MKQKSLMFAGLLLLVFLASCQRGEVAGSLIDVSMKSQVAVLLDEIPESMRERVANDLIAKPIIFWEERAKAQLRLALYRLVFRPDFYAEEKGQLPLPPESIWWIEFQGQPRREVTNSHDLVIVDYTFKSTLLSTEDSPGIAEPALGEIGGVWEESFIFPLDPELIFQRTSFACINEAEFPPNSVDAEEVDTFYDYECDVEEELSNTGCHQTALPKMSCIDALDAKTGKIETALRFERLAWDKDLADKVRVGKVTTEDGADLQVVRYPDYRIIYRYIPSDSCTIVEECVGGSGWRRLLQFTAADWNAGNKALDIGEVDYFLEGKETPLSQSNLYEFSTCHQHYHFTHYATFSLGADEVKNTKRGFCLQSTSRYSNVESSPLRNPYAGCDYQGVEAGWGDEYKAGLECQWMDITDVDTSKGKISKLLTIILNPDGFLCEGTPVFDADGNSVFEPTSFKTEDGKSVQRQKCEFRRDYFDNNVDVLDTVLTLSGEGYVTSSCTRGQIGPLRNCGFMKSEIRSCDPGEMVKLSCSIPGGEAQAVRVCDYSEVLKTGIPCTYNGAVGTGIVALTGGKVMFTCPEARDGRETGGKYSLYTASVYPADVVQEVSCN